MPTGITMIAPATNQGHFGNIQLKKYMGMIGEPATASGCTGSPEPAPPTIEQTTSPLCRRHWCVPPAGRLCNECLFDWYWHSAGNIQWGGVNAVIWPGFLPSWQAHPCTPPKRLAAWPAQGLGHVVLCGIFQHNVVCGVRHASHELSVGNFNVKQCFW